MNSKNPEGEQDSGTSAACLPKRRLRTRTVSEPPLDLEQSAGRGAARSTGPPGAGGTDGSGPEPKSPGGSLQGTAAPAPPQGAQRLGLRGPSLPWGYLPLTEVPSISVPFGEF